MQYALITYVAYNKFNQILFPIKPHTDMCKY